MASPIGHVAAALAIGACFYRPTIPKRVWLAGVVCAVVPDADLLRMPFGVPYTDLLGHRGFTHSLVFAAAVATLIVWLGFRKDVPGLSRTGLWTYLFLATASHGFLDAMTDGGLGVAFFAPFENSRYFLPWRPIRVSPISIQEFFSRWGLEVMESELVWIWLPCAVLASSAIMWRRRFVRGST